MASRTQAQGILVVDDDRVIRTLVQASLEHFGYAIWAAGSAEEALQVFEEHRADIALLVTDVVMPGIDGLELACRLRQNRPELRVLLMSGLGNPQDESKPFLFLAKPFVGPDLLSRVREALEYRALEDRRPDRGRALIFGG